VKYQAVNKLINRHTCIIVLYILAVLGKKNQTVVDINNQSNLL